MRLQRQVSRQVDGNEYAKWIIVIPPSQVEELGWVEGMELESYVKGKILVVRPRTKPKEKPRKMSYEEFREKILELLKTEPVGLPWTEIKNRLSLPQKVPNNLWVRMMEKDIGLVRILDNKTAKTVWRLQSSEVSSLKK
jgi:antitoxin component of MazEF toxin-antitoxin module